MAWNVSNRKLWVLAENCFLMRRVIFVQNVMTQGQKGQWPLPVQKTEAKVSRKKFKWWKLVEISDSKSHLNHHVRLDSWKYRHVCLDSRKYRISFWTLGNTIMSVWTLENTTMSVWTLGNTIMSIWTLGYTIMSVWTLGLVANFKLLPRWNFSYWSIGYVYWISSRSVEIPWRR